MAQRRFEVMKPKLPRRFIRPVNAFPSASMGTPITLVLAMALLLSVRLEVCAADSTAVPVISAQPQSQTVAIGTAVSFSMTATSGTPLSYQWRFNGADIPQATNPVYAVSGAQPQNGGYYAVVVRNSEGVVPSLPAYLALDYPTGGTVNFGNLATSNGVRIVDVPVYDGPGGTTRLSGPHFQAQLYAGPALDHLQPVGSPVTFRSGTAAGYFSGGARVVPTVAPGDRAYVKIGVWERAFGPDFESAVAMGARWTVSNTFVVTTSDPDSEAPLVGLQFPSFVEWDGQPIREQTTNQTVRVGANAAFSVVTWLYSPYSDLRRFQWRKDGAVIAGATNATLTLESVKPNDTGNYSLLVRSDYVNHEFVSSNVSLAVVIPQGGVLTSGRVLRDGAFQSDFFGRTGERYTIQGSEDFASWRPLMTFTNTAGGFQFTDATAAAASRRFYRAVQE